MALADYRLCDVCGAKAFYDAELQYDVDKYPDSGLYNVGAWAVICRKCAQTHDVIDLAALRKLAQAATPGPWTIGFSTSNRPMFMDAGNGRAMLDFPCLVPEAIDQQRLDAAYIAAASPDIILALLGRVEAAERDAARYRHLREHYLRVTTYVTPGLEQERVYMDEVIYGDDADAAIDADIARRKG